MAIYGVTTRDALDPRFKEIGKLRKGGPKQNGQFGIDLEWFRFTSDKDHVAKAFRQAYGEQPASMEVYFPYPTLEVVFPTFREIYGQNQLLKEQCDGMNIIQWQDGYRMARGQRLCEKACKNVDSRPPCPDCPLKPIGRLSVILLPLLQAGIVGTVTVETHGWHDILWISNQLVKYEPLTGRAFRLYREENKIGAPDKKNNRRIAIDKWLVKIEPTQETALLLIGDAQRRARQALLGEPVGFPQLTNGNDEAGTDEPIELEPGDVTDPDEPTENEPAEQEPQSGESPFDINKPDLKDWDDFKAKAVKHLGFENEESVRAAYGSIYPPGSDRPTLGEAWSELVDYQKSGDLLP